MPPSMLLPREPTSSANWALVLVPDSGKLPATHHVAESANAPSTPAPLPALESSKNFATIFLLSSTLMIPYLRWQAKRLFGNLTAVGASSANGGEPADAGRALIKTWARSPRLLSARKSTSYSAGRFARPASFLGLPVDARVHKLPINFLQAFF